MTTSLALDIDLGGQSRPKYEVLRAHLVREIQGGRLKPGESLPTEQTLADGFGVARSTVRQALSALDRDGLIVRVHGKGTYVHDSVKQRLRERLDLFALIVPESRSGFYPALLHGFEAASHGGQSQVIVCNTENCIDKQGNAILQLIDKKVSGVAMVPATEPPTPAYQIRQLQEHQIPVVFCHRAVKGMQAPLLALPYERIGRLAGEELIRQGHGRVAFFGAHISKGTNRYRAGLQAALLDAGTSLDKKDVWRGSSTWFGGTGWIASMEKEIATAIDAIFSGADRPTAIFTTFDSIAELILARLESIGMRVPDDVSLISFGGTWRETPTMRRLMSVVVDESAIPTWYNVIRTSRSIREVIHSGWNAYLKCKKTLAR